MKLSKAPRFHHTQLQHFPASQCSEMVSYGEILHESHCKTQWGFSRLVKTLWPDRIYSETLIHESVIPNIFHLDTPKHFMRGCIYFYSWVYYTSNFYLWCLTTITDGWSYRTLQKRLLTKTAISLLPCLAILVQVGAPYHHSWECYLMKQVQTEAQ